MAYLMATQFIKFYFKLGRTVSETLKILRTVFGDDAHGKELPIRIVTLYFVIDSIQELLDIPSYVTSKIYHL
jgi:hypothetical protein